MPELSDLRPKLSGAVAQGGLADLSGSVQYAPGVEPQGDSASVAFGGPIADFILYGVVNGAFAQGPPNPDDFIDPVNNPMPYWYGPVQVSGGAIQASWAADVVSPSGYNLRFTINPGAASDEAYVEQIVPIGGDRERILAHVARGLFYNSGATSFGVTVSAQYLTVLGVATGALASITSTLASGATSSRTYAVLGSPPTDAYFVRLRIGAQRGAAATTASGSIDVANVRLERGLGRMRIPEEQSPGSYSPGSISQNNGRIDIRASNSSLSGVAYDPAASGGASIWLSDGTVGADTRIYRSAAGVMTVSGHQGARADTGGTIAAAAQADVALTWPTAFPDTNYTVVASAGVNDATSRNAPFIYVREETKTTTGITCRVTNNTAATALKIYVEALAIHD